MAGEEENQGPRLLALNHSILLRRILELEDEVRLGSSKAVRLESENAALRHSLEEAEQSMKVLKSRVSFFQDRCDLIEKNKVEPLREELTRTKEACQASEFVLRNMAGGGLLERKTEVLRILDFLAGKLAEYDKVVAEAVSLEHARIASQRMNGVPSANN
jgi:hypothetical protein